MLDEEMDDIIKNAAAKHHPAYNDGAWEKMEAQLDKHLPQKKDRKKFIFFLLFFLLLGGGALLTVVKFTGNKNSVSSKLAETKANEQPAVTPSTVSTVPVNEKTVPLNEDSKNSPGSNATEQQQKNPVNTLAPNSSPRYNNNEPANGELSKNKRSTITKKGRANMSISSPGLFDETIATTGKKTKAVKTAPAKDVDKTGVAITGNNPEDNETKNEPSTPSISKTGKNTIEEKGKETLKEDKEIKEKEKEKEITSVKPSSSPEKKKPKKNVFSNFGITVSAGPDISFVKLNNTGKTTLNYGAGLSYSFAKRFTARAGFYVSRKIYSAKPDQYTGGTVYPYLDMVDANCKIYEIPVGLTYDIIKKKNYNLFGGIGISSYLMKTEDYDYNYKMPSGQNYTYKAAVKDENKHYFSVLTLSAGYQYRISKRVSVQAEPYMKLPLAGVGIGKIKLNSAGILFTATVKPFSKKN